MVHFRLFMGGGSRCIGGMWCRALVECGTEYVVDGEHSGKAYDSGIIGLILTRVYIRAKSDHCITARQQYKAIRGLPP
jgi:hypothetical protein